MGRLPPEADQVWLVDELARLVATGGDRQLVRAPIRRPTEEDFPDPWSDDLASLDRLCRRMLRYAGIGKLEIRLEPADGGRVHPRGDGGVVWFTGLTEGTVRFVCSERGLEQGGARIEALAREVARAWRSVHGVPRPPDREGWLTDLTAVYLGFGVLTLDRAHERATEGRLAPEHLAFALAAQILARRMSCLDTWRLLRRLDPPQRGDVRVALRRLRPAEEVRRRLGLTLLDDPPAIDLLRADQRPPVD